MFRNSPVIASGKKTVRELSYASQAWSPSHVTHTHKTKQIESVQRRATRWILKTMIGDILRASYFNRIVKLWNLICTVAPPSSMSNVSFVKSFFDKSYFSLLNSVFDVHYSCTWSVVRECLCHMNLLFSPVCCISFLSNNIF